MGGPGVTSIRARTLANLHEHEGAPETGNFTEAEASGKEATDLDSNQILTATKEAT